MDISQSERLRLKLASAYNFVANQRVHHFGYGSPQHRTSKWRNIADTIKFQFLPHYFGNPPGWRLRLRTFGGKRTLPDFCVIGAIKSGTSDLALNLMLHPNVMVPLAKEFILSAPEKWRIFYPTESEKKRHADRYGVALCPYFAPFLHWMELTYNLSRRQPNTKIVLVLRNPVERLYSHWKWEMLLSGKMRAYNLPFLSSFSSYVDQALKNYPEYPMYTACGFPPLETSIYWKAVSYWIERFGTENVIILDIADYFQERDSFLHKVQKFVGLPLHETPAHPGKTNENPINFPPADDGSIAKLKAFFEPHNDRLWNVIGKRFDW